MKTILTPIDFSALSHSTAQFGLELAQRMNARLILLHVVPPAAPLPAFNIPIVEQTSWNDSLHAQMTQAIQHFQEELADYQQQNKLDGVPVQARLVIGQPADGIMETAEEEHASFIVMGTVGASNAWDKLMGSVASAVVQRANIPVWVLSEAVKLSALRKFVYFADLEGNEISCINRVVNLGERLGAKLELVHVSPLDDDEMGVSEAIVEAFENCYAPARITFRHLAYDSVADGIERYVRSHWPDAVVLAHRHRSFIESLFHTSLTRQLALTTKRPLLVVPK